MDKFHFLFVENELRHLAQARSRYPENGDVKLYTATSLKEATSIISENFLHIAIVDLNLAGATRDNAHGIHVLEQLMLERPTCKRILWTEVQKLSFSQLASMIDPRKPLLNGLISKLYTELPYTLVDEERERWLGSVYDKRTVDIPDVNRISSLLDRKSADYATARKERSVSIDTAEIDYLISKLLGQGRDAEIYSLADDRSAREYESNEPALKKHLDDFTRIELTPLSGGKSSAVVVHGQPETRMGHKGIMLVIKIGPRADSAQEIQRYERYVQLLLPLDRRIEMFGTLLGDTLGAVCYSFAGAAPESAVTLAHYIELKDTKRVKAAMMELFNPKMQGWYAHVDTGDSLVAFFKRAFNLNAPRVIVDKLNPFAARIGRELKKEIVDDAIKFGAWNYVDPTQVLGKGCVVGTYKSCIVHGDLNPGNVIVSNDGQVIWIDYKDTTRGPVSLDFAVLEANMRISPGATDRELSSIVNDYSVERELWSQAWKAKIGEHGSFVWKDPGSTVPFWADMAYELLGLMRQNFVELTSLEHAGTCLLVALRLFRIPKLNRVKAIDEKQRLRLLVWIAHLQCVIDRESASASEG